MEKEEIYKIGGIEWPLAGILIFLFTIAFLLLCLWVKVVFFNNSDHED